MGLHVKVIGDERPPQGGWRKHWRCLPLFLKGCSINVVPFRKSKTSDFFDTNIRTFEAKPRNFALKKSDVFRVPKGKRRKTAPEWRITPLLHVMQNIRTSHGVVASDGLLKALNAPKILKSVVISLPCRQEHSSAMRRSRSAPVPSLPVSLW